MSRQISPQNRRETPEPHEALQPVPRAVLVLLAALVAFGIAYIALAPEPPASEWGDGRSASDLAGARPAASRVDGAALYASLCVACHQASGQGLPGVFPPLAGSEWVTGPAATAALIVLHGVNGPLQVRGSEYNGAMPPFGKQLGDAEIAAVLSHIRAQWGNAAPPVSAEDVAAARQASSDRSGPYAGGKELPPPAGP